MLSFFSLPLPEEIKNIAMDQCQRADCLNFLLKFLWLLVLTFKFLMYFERFIIVVVFCLFVFVSAAKIVVYIYYFMEPAKFFNIIY